MKQFKIGLGFNGLHEIIIEANDAEEAAEKVLDGNYDEKEIKDNSDNFEIDYCEEIND